MPANLVRNTEDYGLRARRDRSIQSGRVVIVNRTTNTAILDVGMIDADGNPVYLLDVPFSPQTPPRFNDIVPIHRTSSSAYSMAIGAGAQIGGANAGQTVDSAGVQSLAKSGETTGQQGDLILAAGSNITIDRQNKTFILATTVSAAAASGAAPSTMHFLTNQSEAQLTNEINLGALTSGLLKSVVSGGVWSPSTAVAGSDFFQPGSSGQLDTISSLSPGNANILSSVSGVWAARTPAQIALNLAGTSISSLAAGNDARFTTIAANNQTGTTYTLALSDAGGVVECNNASAITLTIPTQASVAWLTGTVIEIWQQGAGQITITAAAGVTLRSDGAKVKTAAQYATVGLRYRGNNEWILSGDLA